ncbi:MAG: hypothetical protein LUD03_04070 [Firmicutes bacterium]|nr:hypothetical protein [Bacillota bacterium]
MSEFFGVSVDYLCGKTASRNFINTLITDEIDIDKLNYNGITALTEYYKFLLASEKYTNYDV